MELIRQRSLVLSIIVLPLIFTIMPIVVFGSIGGIQDDDTEELGTALRMANVLMSGMNEVELGQAIVGQQFALFFLLIPMIIPTSIAAYSIVGEKTRRTLEPLLAAPISTWELLVGKSMAAFIPTMVLTWLSGLVFIIGVQVMAVTPQVAAAVLSPGWLMMFFACTPMIALIGIAFTVIISSRVNDPRTAQQLSGLLIIPFMLLVFGQLLGIVVLTPPFILGISLVLLVIAAMVIRIAVWMFQRETILTRWR